MKYDLNANRCAKQIIVALIVNNGEYWIGTNSCLVPQRKCPRGKMPSGVGYYLCDDICKQTAHAEVSAVNAAGNKARGGVLYLFGHTYICDRCKKVISEAGIEKTFIMDQVQ